MTLSTLVLNGPNLNLLGTRETSIYGSETLADIETQCMENGKTLGLTVECKQSNYEGELVGWIQDHCNSGRAIIINAGGYTHTSVAIHDALRAFSGYIVELHLSNIYSRETFRHHSYISAVADAVICGFGTLGYRLALEAVTSKIAPTGNI